jgi:chemotaxis protein methyltransferase CheR
LVTDLAFAYLKKKIIAKGGNCAGYKDDFLRRRLEGRMRIKGVATYAEYAHLIDKSPCEFNDLIDFLTVNVSEFFRDITVWNALRQKILPLMIREKLTLGVKELKAWSAGCADGEETYTITILALDALAYLANSFRTNILGTDVDIPSLNRARNGVYNPVRMRLIPKPLLQRYFTPGEKDTFRVVDAVKKYVTFKSHDLFTPPLETAFDLITCRNVVIYFSKEQQQQLYRIFYDALRPGGYLILGKVETVLGEAASMFTCTDLAERIYRRPLELSAFPVISSQSSSHVQP